MLTLTVLGDIQWHYVHVLRNRCYKLSHSTVGYRLFHPKIKCHWVLPSTVGKIRVSLSVTQYGWYQARKKSEYHWVLPSTVRVKPCCNDRIWPKTLGCARQHKLPRLPRKYRGKRQNAVTEYDSFVTGRYLGGNSKNLVRYLLQTRLLRRAVRYFFSASWQP